MVSSPDRILIVAPQPFYEDRGTPIAVENLIRALGQQNRGVDLLTFPIGSTPDLPGLRIFRTRNPFFVRQVPIGFSGRKLLFDLLLVPRLVGLLRRNRYDCIHAVEEAVFIALLVRRWVGIPVVYDMQSCLVDQLTRHRVCRLAPVQKFLRLCERLALRSADLVVCSSGLREYVSRIAPAARVHEWRFPATPSDDATAEVEALRGELHIAPRAPVVVYTGNFAEYQGATALVEAAELVRREHPDVVLVLVGASRSSAPELSETGRALLDCGALQLLPQQPRERVPLYLALADVLVSPRESGDNAPLKIFEYMAAGKPIVATSGEHHRAVLDADRALFAEPTAAGLAEGINRLLDDPDRAQRLGLAARTYALENFGWDAYADSVSRLFEEVHVRTQDGHERP